MASPLPSVQTRIQAALSSSADGLCWPDLRLAVGRCPLIEFDTIMWNLVHSGEVIVVEIGGVARYQVGRGR